MKSIEEAEYRDAVESHLGWCVECGDFTHDCAEPDAEEYLCPVCGCTSVEGAENALIKGRFDFA